MKTFKIEGLNRLKSLKIENYSFTQVEQADIDYDYDYEDDVGILNKPSTLSKSFHILNCESLKSIQIGEWSFSDFGGEFELKNLPQLQSIQIGGIGEEKERNPMGLIQYIEGNKSRNFYCSSFVIRGIELLLNIVMIRSSKSTIHYIR